MAKETLVEHPGSRGLQSAFKFFSVIERIGNMLPRLRTR